MQFDKQGRRIPSMSQVSMLMAKKRVRGRPKKLIAEFENQVTSNPASASLLLPKKRGRGRPRKYPLESDTETTSKPDSTFLLKKRGRGRPRKNPIESDNKVTIKPNYISDVKEKLKLLETILGGYKEIQKIEKETQKNVEKFCILANNSK